jgi:orotate phosphoribosyltransferase-like protein
MKKVKKLLILENQDYDKIKEISNKLNISCNEVIYLLIKNTNKDITIKELIS